MLRMTTLYLYTFTFSKATKAEQNIAGATKREDAKKYVDCVQSWRRCFCVTCSDLQRADLLDYTKLILVTIPLQP